ncbi:MAG TPA: DUF3618 domain-containing protein [Gemmatimonadaceae bacterium]|nr:DUF3618 domain-containing protein [Gemmatimonadaceae bacterium]
MDERSDERFADTERTLGETASDSGEDETVVIRAEIIETRERMGETLDEIGERLNPHVVTERVKDNIREAPIGRVENMARSASDTMNEARSTVMDTVRDNPVPAAMVAVGLGWLIWNGRRERSGASDRYGYGGSTRDRERLYASGAGYPYGSNLYTGEGSYAGGRYGESRYAEPYGESYVQRGYGAEEDEGTMQRARERMSELGEDARERASEVGERAQRMAHDVADRTQDMARSVANRTRRSARRVEDSFYENPLAMGAVTMALGVAAGLAIPETEREAQIMGGARDKLVDRVKDVAEDTREKVQHVASRAMEETKTAAREEGLTGA